MPIRYQADQDLRHHFILAVRRREPSMDFQTALAAGLDRMDDLAVLRKTALEGRILVSHDKRTMPKALAALRNEGLDSTGIRRGGVAEPNHEDPFLSGR